jgi:hypothetical protein
MKMNQTQGKVYSALFLPTIKAIEEYLGSKEFPERRIVSILCILARKGFVPMDRAKALLKDYPVALKILEIPFGAQLKELPKTWHMNT